MLHIKYHGHGPSGSGEGFFTIYRDKNSQPFSIRKKCRLTPKWRKAIFKSLIKGLKSQNIIETSQFMLNLYLKLSLTSFKNKFQQKQLALYKSYASAQSRNPELSHACIYGHVGHLGHVTRTFFINFG